MEEATFTIAHLLKPHSPVNFNERGEIIEGNLAPTPDEFFAEFRFVNSKFLEMVDTILKGSQNPPVIVFQADHGGIYGQRTKTTSKEILPTSLCSLLLS